MLGLPIPFPHYSTTPVLQRSSTPVPHLSDVNRATTIATCIGQRTALDEAYYPSACILDIERRREVQWEAMSSAFRE